MLVRALRLVRSVRIARSSKLQSGIGKIHSQAKDGTIKYAYEVGITRDQPVWNNDGLILAGEANLLRLKIQELEKKDEETKIGVALVRKYGANVDEQKLLSEKLRQTTNTSLLITYFQEPRSLFVYTNPKVCTISDATLQEIQVNAMHPLIKNKKIADAITVGIDMLLPHLHKPFHYTWRHKIKDWWYDFKGWNGAMWRGERDKVSTALYGAGFGVMAWKAWKMLKWSFLVGFGLYAAWKLWKWWEVNNTEDGAPSSRIKTMVTTVLQGASDVLSSGVWTPSDGPEYPSTSSSAGTATGTGTPGSAPVSTSTTQHKKTNTEGMAKAAAKGAAGMEMVKDFQTYRTETRAEQRSFDGRGGGGAIDAAINLGAAMAGAASGAGGSGGGSKGGGGAF